MRRVLVVGDVIVDEHTVGLPLGLSAETPTVVLRQERHDVYHGGAMLVVRHLLRLGADVTFLTVDGHDGTSFPRRVDDDASDPIDFDSELQRLHNNILCEQGWRYSRKMRFWSGGYKLLQVDELNEGRHDSGSRARFLDLLARSVREVDLVVFSDNRHGVLEGVERDAVTVVRDAGIPLWVDTQCSQKGSNHVLYSGAQFLFMNEHERRLLLDVMCHPDPMTLMTELNIHGFIVKRGVDGVSGRTDTMTVGMMKHGVHLPSLKVEAVDTCGAGDAFLAAAAWHGYDGSFDCFSEMLRFANAWAGLSVTKMGAVVPWPSELERFE